MQGVTERDLFHTFFNGMIKDIDHSCFIIWYKCLHRSVRDRNRQSKTCFLYCWSDGQTAVQRHSGNRQWHTSLYTAFYTEEAKHLQNRKKHVKGAARSKISVYLVVYGVQFFLLLILWAVILSHPCMFYTGNHITDGTSYTTYHQFNKTTKWSHITLISAPTAPLWWSN